ncbi:1 5-anhydro-D-fructose reductase [termite gut metagenome]|uniref:1 5-anhydro-D-fructose reductase n=2 Tax=termite gut metagenome TaxID=433724 RepID=A0A5J4QSQ8_9ZZZZ
MYKNDIIRWGFIGCGDVTNNKSGPAFKKAEHSDIVAIMSRTKEKAKAYAEKNGISKWYDDAQKLIKDEEVDAVYIATPPSAHATYAIMAIKAGKPVYIEKPMAVTYEECNRINRIAETEKVLCFVAYYRRYLPYFLKVKELVKQGVIGQPLNMHISLIQPPYPIDYVKDKLPWRLQPDIAGGGGYFYDLAPHQLDIIQDIFGCILEASGCKNNCGGLYDVEDTLSACFRFENGMVGSGSWCFVANENAKEDRIKVIGSKGTLAFSTFSYAPITLYTKEKGYEEIHVDNNVEHVQQPLIQAVIYHLLGKSICSCTGESATTTNWVMDKIVGKL